MRKFIMLIALGAIVACASAIIVGLAGDAIPSGEDGEIIIGIIIVVLAFVGVIMINKD